MNGRAAEIVTQLDTRSPTRRPTARWRLLEALAGRNRCPACGPTAIRNGHHAPEARPLDGDAGHRSMGEGASRRPEQTPPPRRSRRARPAGKIGQVDLASGEAHGDARLAGRAAGGGAHDGARRRGAVGYMIAGRAEPRSGPGAAARSQRQLAVRPGRSTPIASSSATAVEQTAPTAERTDRPGLHFSAGAHSISRRRSGAVAVVIGQALRRSGSLGRREARSRSFSAAGRLQSGFPPASALASGSSAAEAACLRPGQWRTCRSVIRAIIDGVIGAEQMKTFPAVTFQTPSLDTPDAAIGDGGRMSRSEARPRGGPVAETMSAPIRSARGLRSASSTEASGRTSGHVVDPARSAKRSAARRQDLVQSRNTAERPRLDLTLPDRRREAP